MNLPFGKKKKAQGAGGAAAPQAGRRPAVERVASLSAQGISEPEIIRALRSEGYTPMEVDGAMKQALRSAVDGPQQVPAQYPPAQPKYPAAQQAPPAAPELSAPQQPPTEADRRRIFPEEARSAPQARGQLKPPFTMEEMQRANRNPAALPELPGLGPPGAPPLDEMPPGDDFGIPGMGETPPGPIRGPAQKPGRIEGKRQLEEMAEAIVEEKAELFRVEVDQVSDEIRKLEAKIEVIEERFDKLDSKKKTELDEIKTSISGYKESIMDVSARMESVEMAVKDSMAPMMQTLRSLSDAVREIKKR
jgi:hypothetical protein